VVKQTAVDARSIGQNIRARREYLGMTQRDMAEGLSTTPANYSKYESGATNISAPDIARIARLLGVTVGFIYGERDERKPEEIQYEPILDELQSASYAGGLEPGDVSEVAEIIRMKARRRAERQGRA